VNGVTSPWHNSTTQQPTRNMWTWPSKPISAFASRTDKDKTGWNANTCCQLYDIKTTSNIASKIMLCDVMILINQADSNVACYCLLLPESVKQYSEVAFSLLLFLFLYAT
jgi:hypothetical protein